jgi:hypothetical protein
MRFCSEFEGTVQVVVAFRGPRAKRLKLIAHSWSNRAAPFEAHCHSQVNCRAKFSDTIPRKNLSMVHSGIMETWKSMEVRQKLGIT